MLLETPFAWKLDRNPPAIGERDIDRSPPPDRNRIRLKPQNAGRWWTNDRWCTLRPGLGRIRELNRRSGRKDGSGRRASSIRVASSNCDGRKCKQCDTSRKGFHTRENDEPNLGVPSPANVSHFLDECNSPPIRSSVAGLRWQHPTVVEGLVAEWCTELDGNRIPRIPGASGNARDRLDEHD